jgi:hypothetical protein
VSHELGRKISNQHLGSTIDFTYALLVDGVLGCMRARSDHAFRLVTARSAAKGCRQRYHFGRHSIRLQRRRQYHQHDNFVVTIGERYYAALRSFSAARQDVRFTKSYFGPTERLDARAVSQSRNHVQSWMVAPSRCMRH